jgi:hypothetical protein
MKLFITYSVLFLIIGLIVFAGKSEPKPDPKIQEMADKMFKEQLIEGYLNYKDSSNLRKKALRKIYSSPKWANN